MSNKWENSNCPAWLRQFKGWLGGDQCQVQSHYSPQVHLYQVYLYQVYLYQVYFCDRICNQCQVRFSRTAIEAFFCHSMQWTIGSWRLYERLPLEVGQVLTRAVDLVEYEAQVLQIKLILNYSQSVLLLASV